MKRRMLTTMVLFALVGASTTAHAQWRVAAGLTGGSIASSRLYRASAEESTTWRWEQPSGSERFSGSEVLVETSGLFDGKFVTTLHYGLRFSLVSEQSRWGGVLSATLADLDVVAKVRSTRDNVDEVIWDQFFTVQVHAVGTFALAPGENTPYLLAGVGWVQRGSESSSLDQGSPSLVVGAGMRFWSGERSLIDVELRGVWSTLDLDDEDTRLNEDIESQNDSLRPGLASEYAFDGEDAAVAVQIDLSWSYVF